MKRLLSIVLFSLLPTIVEAQGWIQYYPPAGGGVSATGTNAFTGPNSFLDNDNLTIKNTTDPTKTAIVNLAAITTGTKRTYAVPNWSSTLATTGGGTQTFTTTQIIGTGVYLGIGPNSAFYHATPQTPDAPVFRLETTSRAFLIVEEGDEVFDFAHPQQTNPTVFGHSANQSTTQWWGLTHNATHAVISSGTDGLHAITGGSNSFFANSSYLRLPSTHGFGFSSTTNPQTNGVDTYWTRLSAGVSTFRNSVGNVAGYHGGGAAVASAAALPLPTGNLFHVTGTTTVTSITSTALGSGACITLIFDAALTFTDGGNLKLAGDLVTTADDTISLCYDGTNWFETGRAVN